MKKIIEKPEKEYFTVKLETLVPVTFTYRILAESPEKAIEMISKATQSQSAPPHILFSAAKKVKVKVYNLGTALLRFSKNF